ncbi:glycerol-3-phosphate dehydrogenase [Panacagrimonas perspica]|uniref:Glycerol-3-phosphate dehydrogenase n=1 Tax=Panacagrimonas perspica TaxID=381431 RepID=A0A4S3KAI6_9GAMM|nr:glycerol-3-phosphate dehydrogenase/oxidase [Panacagrimonas perspica]TDU32378.1 glycerol-3-phosphate dehydrogenase [Panacagrimonas perspica]THD05309.1 hypothetical protein B1810_00745 [Panacagrimonas perspica]
MSAPDRLAALATRYDLVIIGGGITGAGVLREAVRTGASVLLVDRSDFASGTSSGSSKLVHGGLRYLQSAQWRLTLESVRERGRLLREAPGLVDPQAFLMPIQHDSKPSRALMQTGLFIYDLMAGRLTSRWMTAREVADAEPALSRENIHGAMYFQDAQTDDARLVQRLIEDSRALGAHALNYVAAEDLVRSGERVTGLVLTDRMSMATRHIEAGLVINATGAWTRQFASATVRAPQLRPLRGSHFVFAHDRLPIAHAITWLHPQDRRPVFAFPWEGAVLFGTTDLDHDMRLSEYPRMTAEESAYLLEALNLRFPAVNLAASDALSTYAGVRPVVAGGKDAPSAESRESALWSSEGLISITGGKLTTFRVTARQVLREAARQSPHLALRADAPLFEKGATEDAASRRLQGRLGANAAGKLTSQSSAEDRELVPGTPYSWAELRWSARHEQVMSLDDLLMRRTRMGLVTANGGRELLPRIRAAVQADLGWDDARWIDEEAAYLSMWQQRHAPA